MATSRDDYNLIPLTPTDVDELLRLDQLCYGGFWGRQSYLTEIERSNSLVLGAVQPRSWAADHNPSDPTESELTGILLGFGILWQVMEEAHIISLAVDPAYRGQGIGQKILEALLEAAQQRGCEWATLEVRSSNWIARHLYEKTQFHQLGTRKGYYAETGEDAVIYWKRLPSRSSPER